MLDEKTKALASGRNFAVLTTLMPDGTPQSHVMWVDHDDEHILINTEVHRRKYENIRRDSRATVTIMDANDGYSYSEVRGTVVEQVGGPEARRHIDALSSRSCRIARSSTERSRSGTSAQVPDRIYEVSATAGSPRCPSGRSRPAPQYPPRTAQR